jgi:hypothetical protein
MTETALTKYASDNNQTNLSKNIFLYKMNCSHFEKMCFSIWG